METLQLLCFFVLSPGWSSPEHSWRRYVACLSQESYRTIMSLPDRPPGNTWPQDASPHIPFLGLKSLSSLIKLPQHFHRCELSYKRACIFIICKYSSIGYLKNINPLRLPLGGTSSPAFFIWGEKIGTSVKYELEACGQSRDCLPHI